MESSNSSTIVPSGGGNTSTEVTPPLNEKKRQESPCVHWFVTLNLKKFQSSNKESLHNWIVKHTKTAVWQLEKGDSGNLHIQLTMSLKMKNRMTWLKRHFSKIAHLEKCEKVDASFKYCEKEESRIGGPWYHPEPINSQAIEDELADVELYDWQKEILCVIKEKPHHRRIYWVYDKIGNKGKTSLVRHILLNYDAVLLDGNKRDMAYAWNGQPIILFNFSRSKENKISYDAIESLKDGVIFSSKYESKPKIYNRPHIVCFANWTPDMNKMSMDRWKIMALN